jgi:coenzyme F420 hydrogenase subunit beta
MPENVKNIGSSEILGPYLDIKNVRSKKNSGRFQNGGAVTALLTAALEEGLVDCALVMGEDRWAQKSYPRVVYDVLDLEKCAGSKYTSNAVLEPIQDVIKSVNNIALVGTPCTVQAMGLLRKSSNEFAIKLAHKVRFLLGLFCFEAFDDQLIQEVTRRLCIPPWRIDKMTAGEGMMTIPLPELSGYVKPGCKACADFTAKLSDISVGGTGSMPGMSVVILRTSEGEGLFKIAEERGFIEAKNGVKVETVEKVGKLSL